MSVVIIDVEGSLYGFEPLVHLLHLGDDVVGCCLGHVVHMLLKVG
jgi:hypothetical protein